MVYLPVGCEIDILHGELGKEVYINQPPRYVKQGHENQVYKLKKTLYELKQALRAWYSHINAYFAKEDFLKYPYEHTIYSKYRNDKKILIMCLYVDDLSYTSSDRIMLNDFKKSMMSEFEMLDLGLMHYILDIEVVQLANGVFTSTKKKKKKMFWKFQIDLKWRIAIQFPL